MSLGESVFERPIDLITVGRPEHLGIRREVVLRVGEEEDSSQPQRVKVVFILARLHPGETASSFVVQGLLDFLVSSHEIAVSLREHVVFKIVPMANPDGVFLGNQRSLLLKTCYNNGGQIKWS